uniref:BLOC-1-related complex subunit 6 C-terminal helix domain-containing protein n=1 Tax=Clastoptera arizonana TaxID=38151 RepID=A0A1B6CK02_9HEMI
MELSGHPHKSQSTNEDCVLRDGKVLETITAMEETSKIAEFEEEIDQEMTASYTEISYSEQTSEQISSIFDLAKCSSTKEESNFRINELFNDRPNKLTLNFDEKSNVYNKGGGFDQLSGTVTQDGKMVTYVAEDLERKIKLSSPISKREELTSFGPSSMSKKSLINQFPTIQSTILNDLEIEVSQIATSVDSLTENLAGILHSVSALTVDCLEIYRDVVCKTCDAVDLNIKLTYQLMAKCEELGKSMKPIYKFSEHVKEIKHLLDLFEGAIN